MHKCNLIKNNTQFSSKIISIIVFTLLALFTKIIALLREISLRSSHKVIENENYLNSSNFPKLNNSQILLYLIKKIQN